MAYIGKSIESGTFSVLDTSGNTYNGSNTTFSLGTQVGSPAQLLVSHDGVIQKPGTDYTLASGGTQITFSTAPASGASIFITEISGAVGGPLDSDLNGTELILDTDGDTSITADTDDQIDIKVAGTDQITIKDGALSPVTDNDIDLGTSSLEFKDAFFDGTVTTDGLTVSGTPSFADGSIAIADLDIDGGTDIGADIADSDLIIIDDGAGGTNRKSAVSRLKTYIGGGTHVQTGRTVISGGNPASVDVNSCFSSTYDTYLVIVDRLECTVDSQSLFVRLRNDSGSVTSSNYKYANRYFEDDNNTENQSANSADNKYDIANASDDSSNSGFYHAHMYVHRPADANTQTRMIVQSSFFSDDESDIKVGIGACAFTNPEAHTGISFNISGGGLRDNGTITVYGIAYSQEIFMTKVFDNIVGLRDMTADEQAQYDKDLADWNSKSVDRKLEKVRLYRNRKLIETDYLANSDVTMSDAVKTWRQTLRDLPQNNTTEAKYDELLAKDSDGNLTNSVWTKPS